MILSKENIRQLLVASSFPLIVFCLHVCISLGTSLYETTWWADVVMHYLGGVVIGAFIYLVVQSNIGVNFLGQLRSITLWVLCFSLVALATVFWEFAEWLADSLFHAGAQRGLDDTMLDIFMGLLGGLSTVLFFGKLNKKHG